MTAQHAADVPARRALLAPLLLGGGAALLAWLWLGPLPALARVGFTPHMILHLGVVAAAAPALGLGLALAFGGRRRLRGVLALGLTASAIEMAVVWGWHVPVLHERAALSDAAFVLQQASFLAAALGVWVVAFADRTRAAAMAGVMAMVLTFMHMTMLGVGLAFAPSLIYPPGVCGGVFGLEPLDDQSLGGVLMAAFGGLPYLLGGLLLATRLIGAGSRRSPGPPERE